MRTLITLVIYIFCSLFLGKAYANTKPDPTKKKSPRNIIFILTDDHRYDYMGFTGKVPWLETPNMDKLAPFHR